MNILWIQPEGCDDSLVGQLGQHLPGVNLVRVRSLEAAQLAAKPSPEAAVVEVAPSWVAGLDVVRRLHQAKPRLPVLVLSDVDDESRAVEALRAGAHDYVVRAQVDARGLARFIRYAIERRNLERTLQESEEFFRLIWDHLTDLIAIVDRDGRRIYNSASYRAVLGEPAELLGTDSFQEIHPEDRERIRTLFRESLATGVGRRAEFRFLLRDGSVRHVESQSSVIPDPAGAPHRLLVVGRDVTDRRNAERELREREEFFRLISENVTDFIAVLSRDGRRLYNSPSYRALFGDVDALRGSDSFAEIHPDDREMVRRVFQETVTSGRGRRIEYRFVLSDGEVRQMESVGSVVRDAQGATDRVVVVSRDVTERRRSEEALRESEERYRRLLASTSDYNFSVTVRHGRSVATTHSPGCESVTGHSAAEFAADPQLWYRIIHEPDRRMVLEQVDRILKGESPPPLEHRIVRRDGALRWIRNTAVPRRNPEGRLVTYDGIITDVTDRRRAERLLEVQHGVTSVLAGAGTLRDAIGRILCAVCVDLEWDVGHFWEVEAEGARLRPLASWSSPGTGYGPFETACQAGLAGTEPDFAGAAGTKVAPAWETDIATKLDPARAAAAARCGLLTGFAVPVAYGDEVLGVLEYFSRQRRAREEDLLETFTAVASQVSQFIQRKRLDQSVRESQERLELVILGSNDGVWDWDVQSNAVYFSPRWKGMLGYADYEIENRFEAWQELTHPDDRQRALKTVADYFEGKSAVYELEHRLRHKDGSYRWILARGVALRDSTGRPMRMAGSHVDLTDRKRSEEQLQATNEELARSDAELRATVASLREANAALQATQLELIQAAKMEVVGTLAAGVAHEVKNPLQTLVLGLDYLDRDLAARAPSSAPIIQEMRKAVTRADTIVRGLLAFSAVNQAERSELDLNALVRQSLGLSTFELNRNHIALTLDLAEDLGCVHIDGNKIEQVILNLVMNAVHAMPGGGTLTLRTRRAACPPGPGSPGGPGVIFEVEDSGTGIPPEALSRIFDPFFTTKPQGVGTGLGLSVTKRIVELHGGTIQIQNRAEGGVRVTTLLPSPPAP